MTWRNWGDLFESGPVLIREIFKSELELEDLLCSRFPTDAIEPVAKGELGADSSSRLTALEVNRLECCRASSNRGGATTDTDIRFCDLTEGRPCLRPERSEYLLSF